jgi:predicted O-methyltransferase YrrM
MDFSNYLKFITETEAAHGFHQWDNFKSDFGVNTYYADYVKAGFKYKPKSILEIGVRFGYSGMALVYGAGLNGVKDVSYTGLDDEGYIPGSNEKAKSFFAKFFPDCSVNIFKVNTVENGFPEEVNKQTYDLIHVDGNHSVEGALKDMLGAWNILNPGGIMIVDDCTFWDVGQAINRFNPEGLKESFVVMNERGQKYYQKI